MANFRADLALYIEEGLDEDDLILELDEVFSQVMLLGLEVGDDGEDIALIRLFVNALDAELVEAQVEHTLELLDFVQSFEVQEIEEEG